MKVVLFCGGLGTRLREHSDTIPKPLVNIGYQPILWYLMKYYAYFGHRDFVICLGYRGDMIRDFFLNYDGRYAGDLLLSGGERVRHESTDDVADWNIQFIETGLHSNIGMRLRAVRRHLEDEPMFLANYSDQLSDLPLPEYIDAFDRSGAVAGFTAVRPVAHTHHVADISDDGHVTSLSPAREQNSWVNGGFLVLRNEIFDYLEDGEELVEEPFTRLIAERRLFAYRYEGFWRSMDTFKDKIAFDRMWGSANEPWKVWARTQET